MRGIAFPLRYFEEIVGCALMTVMTLATVANVIARYMFNSPIQWAEELSRYSFIWLVFIGAALCSKHRRHIAIDTLTMVLPARARLTLSAIIDVGVMAIMAVIIYYSWILIGSATHPTAELKIPQWVVYLAVPLSAGLIILHSLSDFKGHMRSLLGGEQA